jgi:broad specificity phosphatase PhoE
VIFFRIAAIPVKYFYASPYERTVDTAHLILGESHPNVQIRLEPGLIESLHRRKTEKPTYQKPEELINLGKYQRIDEKYKPRYDADKLEKYAKKVQLFGDQNSMRFRI